MPSGSQPRPHPPRPVPGSVQQARIGGAEPEVDNVSAAFVEEGKIEKSILD